MLIEIITILGFVAVVLLVVAGLILSAINLPGIWLVFAGAVLAAFLGDFQEISWWWIALFLLFALFGSLLDNLVVLFSTKKFGAGRWGMAGAIVGMIVGFFVGGFIGVILGPLVGVVLFEVLIDKKSVRQAFKAGLGTVVGFILSIVLKFGLSLAIVGCVILLLWR